MTRSPSPVWPVSPGVDPRRQGDPEDLSLHHELRPDVPALGHDLTRGSGNPHQFSSVQSLSRV